METMTNNPELYGYGECLDQDEDPRERAYWITFHAARERIAQRYNLDAAHGQMGRWVDDALHTTWFAGVTQEEWVRGASLRLPRTHEER